jgi:uncharacterized protein YndB with AHSA1/START domain/DNA-binding transcriptional ArsR family regulator
MKAAKDDRLLHAVGNARRRRILELLRGRPGLSTSELAEEFDVSRIAVLKHVRVLEESGLVGRRRRGKALALFVRDEPSLADALARRLAECAPLWEHRLASLKRDLEEGPRMSDSPRHVYVVYIRTTPEKLWDALVKPEMTRRFYFGTDVRSALTPGAPIEYVLRDPSGQERVPVVGEVIEATPGRRLVHTFSFPATGDAPTKVTYDIEPAGAGTVKLTLTHEGFVGETKTWREVGGGWPQVVSALKTLLETGETLDID